MNVNITERRNAMTAAMQTGKEAESAPPSVLVVAVRHWPFVTRLCMEMAYRGVIVRAIVPSHHALHRMQKVSTDLLGRTRWRALADIGRAITKHAPSMVIPGDETACDYLQELYARSAASHHANDYQIADLIERSLGAPSVLALGRLKSHFVEIARAARICVPNATTVRDANHLQRLLVDCTFPVVLKQDASHGGQGVCIVSDRNEAERALRDLRFRASGWNLFKEAVKRLDLSPFKNLRRAETAITLQSFIEGVPANRAVICWRGEVLAGLSVEVVQSLNSTGPATVVRVTDVPAMEDAAQRMVRRLGLSGFVGFDFVLKGDQAYLIEMNTRPTQICHLALDAGSDFIGALQSILHGKSRVLVAPGTESRTIALFPAEIWRDVGSHHLQSAFHDVPSHLPDFVAAYRAPLPDDPHWLIGAFDFFRRLSPRAGAQAMLKHSETPGGARTGAVV